MTSHTLSQTPRFTSLQIAEQVAADLNARGQDCKVTLEPHFGTDGEISHFGPLATVAALDDDGQTCGFENDAIWEAEQAAQHPQMRMAA